MHNLIRRSSSARVILIALQKFILMPDNSGVSVGNRLSVPVRCRLEIVSVTDNKNSCAVKRCPVLFILRHDLAGSDHDIVLARRLNGRADSDTVFRLRAVIAIVRIG